MSVLENLKKHCIRAENISKDIYLKLGRDKNNNLIGLYFNIEQFVKYNSLTVYLFTQSQDFFNPSVLFLRYEDYLSHRPQKHIRRVEDGYGYALICDIRIVEKRIGHGTFMLSNIEPILLPSE